MAAPRALRQRRFALVIAGLVVLGACADEPASNPLPTIGLGSEFGTIDPNDAAALEALANGGASNAETIDSVVIVGDSITAGAERSLYDRFAARGLGAVIEAFPGKRMVVSSSGNPGGASVAAALAADPARDSSRELWVVALGTNDISQYASPDAIAAAVNEILAVVPPGAPLVWVDTYIATRLADAEAVNLVIRERVARRGNAVMAAWSVHAGVDGVLSGDGVHPTPAGADVFAQVVVDTVVRFLGR